MEAILEQKNTLALKLHSSKIKLKRVVEGLMLMIMMRGGLKKTGKESLVEKKPHLISNPITSAMHLFHTFLSEWRKTLANLYCKLVGGKKITTKS